jgi:hypothetical protein
MAEKVLTVTDALGQISEKNVDGLPGFGKMAVEVTNIRSLL